MKIIVERFFEFEDTKDAWLSDLASDPSMGDVRQEVVKAIGGRGERELHKITAVSFRNMFDTKMRYPDAKEYKEPVAPVNVYKKGVAQAKKASEKKKKLVVDKKGKADIIKE